MKSLTRMTLAALAAITLLGVNSVAAAQQRSEERRVGKEC